MMSDAASFVDLSAVHVLTMQTIAAVAEASGSGSVEAARFRANVLIDAKKERGSWRTSGSGTRSRSATNSPSSASLQPRAAR
jgi:hypothetical protein